jgi:hypothetical protein
VTGSITGAVIGAMIGIFWVVIVPLYVIKVICGKDITGRKGPN